MITIPLEILFTIVSIIVSISTLFILMLFYLRTKKNDRYDNELKKAQIEIMRNSYEKKIYDMTNKMMSNDDRWKDANHLLLNTQEYLRDFNSDNQNTNNFLKAFNITPNEMLIDRNSVFVLMPFNATYATTFNTIKKACSEVGLKCFRGDEEYIESDLLSYILRRIVSSRFIIALVDGRNPNVFYELGIAHALGKQTIMITSDLQSLPVDIALRQYQLLVYKNPKELYTQLTKYITKTVLNKDF